MCSLFCTEPNQFRSRWWNSSVQTFPINFFNSLDYTKLKFIAQKKRRRRRNKKRKKKGKRREKRTCVASGCFIDYSLPTTPPLLFRIPVFLSHRESMLDNFPRSLSLILPPFTIVAWSNPICNKTQRRIYSASEIIVIIFTTYLGKAYHLFCTFK